MTPAPPTNRLGLKSPASAARRATFAAIAARNAAAAAALVPPATIGQPCLPPMFTITLNVVHSVDAWTKTFLEGLLTPPNGGPSPAELLAAVTQGDSLIMKEFDDLKTAVANNTSQIGSAKAALAGIKGQLDAAIASNDPAAFVALSNQLASDDNDLATAIVANTTAPPAPSPVAGV